MIQTLQTYVDRQFDNRDKLEVTISDLIYVRVGTKWKYVCTIIDDILNTFKIDRSLSRKGNPYDNAVSGATNKSLKIEFIYQHKFETLE